MSDDLMFGSLINDGDGELPQFKKIAKYYERKITKGELEDGAKLPSEREMCELFSVSGITARNAIRLLQEWGMAVGYRGKGNFVRRPIILTRVAPQRYFRGQEARAYVREAERTGVDLHVEHHTKRVRAPAAIARRLGINTGDAITSTRYRIVMGDMPVTVSQSYEPLELTRGTPIELPHEGPLASAGIVERFDSIGLHANEVEEQLVVRTPTASEADLLAMPRTSKVIEIEQTFRRLAFDAEDIVLETADIVFAADRYKFVYKMAIPN